MFSQAGRMMLVLGCAVGAPLACQKSDPKPEPVTAAEGAAQQASASAAPAAPTIVIQSATYGAACGVPAGNHTNFVTKSCNGKVSCKYAVNNANGDPKPGCAKDFVVEYRCGAAPEVTTIRHPAAQDENYFVELSCNK